MWELLVLNLEWKTFGEEFLAFKEGKDNFKVIGLLISGEMNR